MEKRLYIACTPRTGNTWLRKLLSGSLAIPEHAAHSVDEVAWNELPAGCIVGIHAHATSEFREALRRAAFRTVVTVRHPLDVLVSILQFAQHEPATARWLGGEQGVESGLLGAAPTSPAFLDYCLSPRAAVLLGISAQWLPYADAVARYETFVRSPKQALGALLRKLHLAPARPLEEAVAQNAIETLRSDLSTRHHFWRGTPGLWEQLLPRDIARAIYDRHRGVFKAFGYGCRYDRRLSTARARVNWQAVLERAPAAPRRAKFFGFALFGGKR